MKRLLVALLFAITGTAHGIILTWSPDPEWGEEVGIRIYWEDAVTGEEKSLDFALPATSADVPNSNFSMGTDYSFWATAFTAAEESEDSNVVDAYYNSDGMWAPDPPATKSRSGGKCFIGALF